MTYILLFQKQSGAKSLPLESFQCSVFATSSSNSLLMASHKSWDFFLFGDKSCSSRDVDLVGLEALLMETCLMPSTCPWQQQLMGFSNFVTSKWQCFMEWIFPVSILDTKNIVISWQHSVSYMFCHAAQWKVFINQPFESLAAKM